MRENRLPLISKMLHSHEILLEANKRTNKQTNKIKYTRNWMSRNEDLGSRVSMSFKFTTNSYTLNTTIFNALV